MITQTEAFSTHEGHMLVLQDTTELNYHQLQGLLKVNDPHIGVISDDKSTGFLCHAALAVDADSCMPIGISAIDFIVRRFGRPNKKERKYHKLPIEEKESYKWLKASQASQANLPSSKSLTIIGDRENDIYEYFALPRAERVNLVVRSSWNRKLTNGLKLETYLAQQAWQAETILPLGRHHKRPNNETTLQVRWAKVDISVSPNRKAILKDYPQAVGLYVVELEELAHLVPKVKDSKAIHWRLFTTYPITTKAQALQIARWYSQRWWIEDLFRILKRQGLEVESSQLAEGIKLQKLVSICLGEAFKILLMRQARDGQSGYEASCCFDDDEIAFLEVLDKDIKASTKSKYKNPHVIKSLAWASWIIAILGGWQAADLSKRPPGVITLSRGLKKFHQQFNGWQAALQHFQELSKKIT